MTTPQTFVDNQFFDRRISVKDFKGIATYQLVMNNCLCRRFLLLFSIFFDFWLFRFCKVRVKIRVRSPAFINPLCGTACSICLSKLQTINFLTSVFDIPKSYGGLTFAFPKVPNTIRGEPEHSFTLQPHVRPNCRSDGSYCKCSAPENNESIRRGLP